MSVKRRGGTDKKKPFPSIYKGPSLNNKLQKFKEMKVVWSKNLQFLLKNCLKLPCRKKFLFWVFANHPAVHNGGVGRGRVCGCGCWRYWHVTGDMWNTLQGVISLCARIQKKKSWTGHPLKWLSSGLANPKNAGFSSSETGLFIAVCCSRAVPCSQIWGS